MLKKIGALFIAVAVLFLSGCTSNVKNMLFDKKTETNDTDISIFSYKADTFCPIVSNNEANLRMLNIIYEGLVSVNDDLMPQPCLAESWTPSADGLQWTIKLRKNALWHNGNRFGAKDVVYTVEQIKNQEKSAYSYNVSNIVGIEAIDTNTVKIILNKPVASFMSLMYFPIIESADQPIDAVNFKPNGTGPYKFEDRNEGNIYYLVANDSWWGGYIETKTVKVRMLPGGETSLYAFSSNSIDLVPTDDMDWGKFIDTTASSYTSIATPIYNFLGINHSNKVLGDTAVRQAMSLAIDRNALVEKAMLGYAVAANSPVRKEWFVYGSQEFEYKQNTIMAKKIMEENEWKLNGNAYSKVIDNASHTAQFNILVNENNTTRVNIADMIKNNLDSFGIKVSVTKLSYEEYLERIQSGNYDAFVGSMELSPDLDFGLIFGEGNMFGFNDEEMFSVMAEMQKKQSQDEIKAGYAEFINLFEQLNPVVGLFFEDTVLLYSKRISEDRIKPSYFDVYRGIESMRKGEA